MNEERQLEIQSCLDGELSGWRARRVARSIQGDPEAEQLAAELQMTKSFLADNEMARTLHEEPQFYWSRIEQAIKRLEDGGSVDPERGPAIPWRRLLGPFGAVAMAVFLAVLAMRWSPTSVVVVEDPLRHLAEVENLSEYTDSVSFRSTSENMFVVWIEDKGQVAVSEADFIEEEDLLFQ